MAGAPSGPSVVRRPVTSRTGRCAVLYPAVAEAARRAGATAVGLIDVECSAGPGLLLDRVGLVYDSGQALGDGSSPVQLSASVVGRRPIPDRSVPPVTARIGIDRSLADAPEAARSLRTALETGDPDGTADRGAASVLTASGHLQLLPGEVLDRLPEAVERVPADALPVVTTAWALARLSPAGRLRFLQRLGDAATGRPVAWVSAEGVGVAPAVPTLGDRRASGHSILGVAVLDASSVTAAAVGRCWSRGRMLAWLAGG